MPTNCGSPACGIAALISALLAVAVLHGAAHRPLVTEESLHD